MTNQEKEVLARLNEELETVNKNPLYAKEIEKEEITKFEKTEIASG